MGRILISNIEAEEVEVPLSMPDYTLVEHHSTIHIYGLPRDEITSIRAQKQSDSRKILRDLKPFKATAGGHGFKVFLRIYRISPDTIAYREAWGDGIDRDPIVPQLPRQGPCQPDDSPFGRDIM